ncbi:nuclease s1 precursor [Trichoderma arundinaceum]|uniref:Nuclease s1 n=1 Tax=Trichoderma arundinaceum TaxID=490622 RepID=A0A395NIA9_TRIAR|nr:nuclease s1 precursor [Trichoderma arundinaceum]
MKLSPNFVSYGLLCLPGVIAWGELGHNTTGYLASYFVSPSTEAHLKNLLNNQNEDYLANVATWADLFRKRPEGRFTRNFHFIDAHDDPSNQVCEVDYIRDCKAGGCIISALANYTERARDKSLCESQRQQAVKLLVHFIGDLHQPLHNEDVGKGGTQIQVLWRRAGKDLHEVWDSSIPEKMTKPLRTGSNEIAFQWAKELAREINDGKFAAKKQKWLEKFDPTDPIGTAMAWSNEANDYVCTHGEIPQFLSWTIPPAYVISNAVFPPGLDPKNIEGKNLTDNGYYDKAAPIVEEQVARAGFRMAAWLDGIFDSVRAKNGVNKAVDEL